MIQIISGGQLRVLGQMSLAVMLNMVLSIFVLRLALRNFNMKGKIQ
jgi:hypothetical protein